MDLCFKLIVLVQVIEVVFNLLVGLLNEGVEFALGEVLAPAIYSLELAAVDGDEFSAEKIAFPTEEGEGAADLLDCFMVIPAKVSDGLAEGPGQGNQV